ncbi:SCO4848 family membrane protein [Homoserinibacter sp. YIM 151385]|uniref:SCO4848 family membrane protein n=1 Tax=Homoserinibacter sp. YIM 151385 TaxID=2985506 RepID=UPI0022EFFF56|nr:hypothetical protein [Homoserinibacter sp. YIM 151385]WBU39060.1 hypothetical protein OF852_05635 [Homoserinibacter sp. YIM 151385]
MTVAIAVLLFLNAAFNVVTWPRFLKRVIQDPRARDEHGRATTFLTVHIVLVVIALVLAVASAILGVALLAGVA